MNVWCILPNLWIMESPNYDIEELFELVIQISGHMKAFGCLTFDEIGR